MSRRLRTRKLLVASLGLASISYAAACEKQHPPGNLMAPQVAPDVLGDAGASSSEGSSPPSVDASAAPADAAPALVPRNPRPGDLAPSTSNFMTPPPAPDAGAPKAKPKK